MYKILIVEDEDMIRNGLKFTMDWLKADCVIVGSAVDGQDGVEKIGSLRPDIVITDVNMPIKNGIEMLEETVKVYSFSTIIISGYDDFKYAQSAIRLGVSEYLLKPVDHGELLEAVERAKETLKQKKEYEYIHSNLSSIEDINVINHMVLSHSSKTSKYVSYIIDYVKEHYREKISIQDFVPKLDMSVTYLNQKFKEQTCYTFNEFLNRYRVQMAIERLKIGEDKITMIALDVGFYNYRYFSHVFKKYTRVLPSEMLEYFRSQNNLKGK
ncbi:response regulator transcription factor [Bacillus sp. B-jedd]|uniref:response regulator transcription factor n=1 Tax=Bacillus sp. B-jedd TaxID=1476857 RepID=UPI0005155618|nr:response regulator [Bacillus sp. B-jedd]CEG29140.1 two-component response regulator [Bacillus sp. B-jedd]